MQYTLIKFPQIEINAYVHFSQVLLFIYAALLLIIISSLCFITGSLDTSEYIGGCSSNWSSDLVPVGVDMHDLM